MNSGTQMGPRAAIASVVGCFVLALMMATSAVAKDKLPEVSSDGLHLLKHSKVRIAYVKPGATFDQFTKVKILDCFVQFKKNYKRDYNMNELGLEGRVNDKEMDEIKQRVAAEFNKVFTEVLTKDGHPVVDTIGKDVLLLRPAIMNLDVSAPDTMRTGMDRVYVASAGQMTLFLELYDSATSTLLARIIDPEAGQNGGIAMAASRVTNKSQADQILRRWADLLSSQLGHVREGAASG